jgi:hypothetical protein
MTKIFFVSFSTQQNFNEIKKITNLNKKNPDLERDIDKFLKEAKEMEEQDKIVKQIIEDIAHQNAMQDALQAGIECGVFLACFVFIIKVLVLYRGYDKPSAPDNDVNVD